MHLVWRFEVETLGEDSYEKVYRVLGSILKRYVHDQPDAETGSFGQIQKQMRFANFQNNMARRALLPSRDEDGALQQYQLWTIAENIIAG